MGYISFREGTNCIGNLFLGFWGVKVMEIQDGPFHKDNRIKVFQLTIHFWGGGELLVFQGSFQSKLQIFHFRP